MHEDDTESFQKQMSGVKRLDANRVNLSKKKPTILDLGPRNETVQKKTMELSEHILSKDVFDQVDPREILCFKQKDLDGRIFKKLRQGKLPIQSSIDLHGMYVIQAKIELLSFIEECINEDFSIVLIVHGRGEGREKPALLKSWTNSWLKEIDTVRAFHSAKTQHGGTGATYALLNNYRTY
jgi:DNA-nicking Smr family endonuclease